MQYKDSSSFRPADNIWMWCEAAGGVRYQHHGIVLCAKGSHLKIADFTAPDSGTFALPGSVASGSTLPHWHGVRVTTVDNVMEWKKEIHVDRDVDEDNVVLQRVKFLMRNPHLIPEYDLLESNCETVAVWCKTGSFRTFQIAGLLDRGRGKRNDSATIAASSILASSVLGPLAIPAVIGAAVSFSALMIKELDNENKWNERTRILNEEFKKWEESQEHSLFFKDG